ncbi:MAG: type II secretion system F family protein [Chthonomonadales bacterium]|nr:type II secretion system F family protein [Chthonomonadales bacterium]
MPEYEYTARDASGVQLEGRINAENSGFAVARLRAQGLDVDRIRVADTRDAAPPTMTVQARGPGVVRSTGDPITPGVPLADQAVYFRQFAVLIKAGLSLYEALTALTSQTRNPTLKAITSASQSHIMAGGRLSDSLERHPYVFSRLQISMLRAAEQGGMLEEALERLASYLDRELALRRTISRATLYPKIVLLSAVFILGRSFLTDGVPAIAKLIIGSMGRSSYSVLDYLSDTVLVLGIVAVWALMVSAVGRYGLCRSLDLRAVRERVIWIIPGVGSVSRSFAVSRFARAFSALSGAGLSMNGALSASAEASGSPSIERGTTRIQSLVNEGRPLADAFSESGIFPRLIVDMLRTGEQTGNIDSIMEHAANHLEREAEMRASQYSIMFGTGVYLIVALLVGMVVINSYAGYASGYGK